MCDINSGINYSSMVSFADDTRLYYGISNVDDCLFSKMIGILYMSGLLLIICSLVPNSSNIYV